MNTEVIAIELAADGRAWVDGRELAAAGGDLEETRAAALREVTLLAQRRSRSIRVAALDPDGREWRLLVHPSGLVQDEGQATQEMTGDPDALTVPASLRPRTAAVATALENGRELEAAQLARNLETDVTAMYGARHPYALRARELLAHTRLAIGMPGGACEMYASAARGWAALESTSGYRRAAQRAYACWHQVHDPAQAIWQGQQVVEVLRLGGGDAEQAAVREVLRRTDELHGDVAA